MCPHGYHHSGFMVTPALGPQDVRLHIVGKDCIVESPECSSCKQRVMQSADSELHNKTICTRSHHISYDSPMYNYEPYIRAETIFILALQYREQYLWNNINYGLH